MDSAVPLSSQVCWHSAGLCDASCGGQACSSISSASSCPTDVARAAPDHNHTKARQHGTSQSRPFTLNSRCCKRPPTTQSTACTSSNCSPATATPCTSSKDVTWDQKPKPTSLLFGRASSRPVIRPQVRRAVSLEGPGRFVFFGRR